MTLDRWFRAARPRASSRRVGPSSPRPTARPDLGGRQGVTLVELLVSSTIGLVLLGSAVPLFITNRHSVEQQMAVRAVQTDVHVTVELAPKRVDRPEQVRVAYEVTDPDDGRVVYDQRVTFRNEAGQQFDRVPRAEMANA